MNTTHDLTEAELRAAIREWAATHHNIGLGGHETVDVALPESLCRGLEEGSMHVSVLVLRRNTCKAGS